jgi:acyl carrier protein
MSLAPDLNATIARYATSPFTDVTTLQDAGLESLSLLRLAVDVAEDDDAEIDATRLVDLKTVSDLKDWLTSMTSRSDEALA